MSTTTTFTTAPRADRFRQGDSWTGPDGKRYRVMRGIAEASVEEHVERQWLPAYRRHDPRDLIAMLDTWLAHDVAAGGDLSQALAGIEAHTAVVACDRDLYFTVEDMAAEAAAIPGADFHVLRSTLGHRAGNPHSSPSEQQWLRQIVEQLLDG